jgi:hypothetical protein
MSKGSGLRLFFLLLTVSFSLSETSAGPASELVTMAVLTMPAPEVLRQNYYREGEEFTFVPGSMVDFVGLAGSMAVLVPFDINEEKLKFLLDKSDSMIFSSSESELTDVTGQPTPYMKAISIILDYAAKRNNEGKYFPVLAFGNGMDALIKSVSSSASSLKCNSKSDNVSKVLTPESLDVQISLDWKSFFHNPENQEVLKSGNLYFDNRCHTEVTDFNIDKGLSGSYYYMATSEGNNKKTVEMILHKTYPFLGVHFHAEKHIYERGAPHQHLDRSEKTIDYLKRLILNFRRVIMARGAPKLTKNISSQLKQYFAMFRPSELPLVDRWERVYTFQRYHGF